MLDAETRRAFETLVAAALCDGDLSDPERQVLHRKATEWDIPLPMLNHLIDRGHQGQLKVSIPADAAAREDLFDQLIDLACADGRVDASEYHLLAKFASHLGLALADVKARIKARVDGRPLRVQRKPEARRETVVRQTVSRPKPPPAPEPRKAAAPQTPELDRDLPSPAPLGPMQLSNQAPAAPPSGPIPLDHAHAPGESSVDIPLQPPGPVQLPPPSTIVSPMPDFPPITLELLKQSLTFEAEEDSLRTLERMMEISRVEAVELRARILRAFPNLKPAAASILPRRRH